MDTWPEHLLAEDIPLNVTIVFRCEHGGVRRVLINNIPQIVSKSFRKFAFEWIKNNRQIPFLDWANLTNGFNFQLFTNVQVDFHEGKPVGQAMFGNRQQKRDVLRQLRHPPR